MISLSSVQSYFPGISAQNVHMILHYFRKKGKTPKWLVTVEGKRGHKIKLKEFEHWLGLDNRIRAYGTDNLYWIFMATGWDDLQLAKFMAEKSRFFKNQGSWYMFFNSGMFMSSDEQGYRMLIKPTRFTEFVRIGTKHIYLLNKAGKFEVKNKEIF